MENLQGRVAIITGAGRGLGRSHALRFAELGAAVVVNDMGGGPDGGGSGTSPAHEVVEEITAAGGQAVAHIGSAADWSSGAEMVDIAVKKFGSLDILVNNAGILRDRTVFNMTEAEFDSVVNVHQKGHFVPTRHATAYWREQFKAGKHVKASIINTSSGAGLFGNTGQTNYAGAKAAIVAMTIVAARELERYGVRANVIAPAARTRLTLQTPGMGDRLEEEVKKAGFDSWAPENVTPLVAWLAQADCPANGQIFTSRGGHIGLIQGFTEAEAFDKDGRWTEDELDTALAGVPTAPPAFATSI